MSRVRSLLCVVFAIAAGIFLLLSPLRLLVGLHRDPGESIKEFAFLTSITLIIPASALLFASACWTYLRRKPAARILGIIASFMLFLIACGTSYFQYRGTHGSLLIIFETNFILLALSVVGTIAFAQWDPGNI